MIDQIKLPWFSYILGRMLGAMMILQGTLLLRGLSLLNITQITISLIILAIGVLLSRGILKGKIIALQIFKWSCITLILITTRNLIQWGVDGVDMIVISIISLFYIIPGSLIIGAQTNIRYLRTNKDKQLNTNNLRYTLGSYAIIIIGILGYWKGVYLAPLNIPIIDESKLTVEQTLKEEQNGFFHLKKALEENPDIGRVSSTGQELYHILMKYWYTGSCVTGNILSGDYFGGFSGQQNGERIPITCIEKLSPRKELLSGIKENMASLKKLEEDLFVLQPKLQEITQMPFENYFVKNSVDSSMPQMGILSTYNNIISFGRAYSTYILYQCIKKNTDECINAWETKYILDLKIHQTPKEYVSSLVSRVLIHQDHILLRHIIENFSLSESQKERLLENLKKYQGINKKEHIKEEYASMKLILNQIVDQMIKKTNSEDIGAVLNQSFFDYKETKEIMNYVYYEASIGNLEPMKSIIQEGIPNTQFDRTMMNIYKKFINTESYQIGRHRKNPIGRHYIPHALFFTFGIRDFDEEKDQRIVEINKYLQQLLAK